VLTLEHCLFTHVYGPIILDPTRHVAKKPSPQYVCGEGPSKMGFKKIELIQLTVFNNDRQMAKSITIQKSNVFQW
jgi:hypothetical protein